MLNTKNLLAVSILACFASTVFAIHCYTCESLSTPKCGEAFEGDDFFKMDCARVAPSRFLQSLSSLRNATGCMKKVLEAVSGHPQIIRSCYFGDISNTQSGCQSDPTLPFVRQLSCDVCQGDLCNSSTSMAPIALTILAFFALARLFS